MFITNPCYAKGRLFPSKFDLLAGAANDSTGEDTTMRKLALVAAAFLVSAQAPYVPTAPQAPILNVEISVTTQGGGKPAFYGTTNLPDGFEAIATFGDSRRPPGTGAQDKIVVHAHHFTAGPFSDGRNPLPGGTYRFSIHSPLADLQPEGVRKVIGGDGSLMRGPLAAPIILGGRVFPGFTVHFETQVELR